MKYLQSALSILALTFVVEVITWIPIAVVIGIVWLLGGCAVPVESAPLHDVADAGASLREFKIDIHADTEFTPDERTRIGNSTIKWLKISGGRVALTPVYDLDFSTVEGLADHVRQHHTILVRSTGEDSVVTNWEAKYAKPNTHALGITVFQPDKSAHVYLAMDRLSGDRLMTVVTHELGHVIGLDDLPDLGSIMSGFSFTDRPPVLELSAADVAACRASRYCE